MAGHRRPIEDGTNGEAGGSTFSGRGRRGRKRRAVDLEPIKWEGEQAVRSGVALWDFSDGLEAHLRPPAPQPQEEAPAPAAELRRARMIEELRQCYDSACRDVMGLDRPPADSVDRWLLEQLAQPRQACRHRDPLLAKPRIAQGSRVLLRELLAEVPLRCPTRAYGPVAREAVCRYVKNTQDWLDRLGAKADPLRVCAGELATWLEQRPAAESGRRDDCLFKQKLVELSNEGGFSSRLRLLAEPLAVKVIELVSAAADRVAGELTSGAIETQEKQHVSLEVLPEARGAKLRFAEDTVLLSDLHFRKLRSLYAFHNGARPSSSVDAAAWDSEFQTRLYAMARRYVTFIGIDPESKGHTGGNMHAAAPEPVFAWLRSELGARCECFASPLNCYFARFFSAFPDVDRPFGSLGSFFDADDVLEGSFEVGPPYTEEVLELTARRLLQLLQRSASRPLSFVLFVPDWEGATALTLLGGPQFDPYRRTHHGTFALARGRDHQYISGIQFFADAGADASRRYYVVPHGTRVYVLQNDAGAAKWPFTASREEELLAKMRP